MDSCNSGAITWLKGGKLRKKIVFSNNDIEGHAYLTSSSRDENAQESDSIGSSYFTYYFLTGLRRAADSSLDKKITLNEAYNFAYKETMKQTEFSRGGVQHPSYEIELSGKKELVLTDLRKAHSKMKIPKNYVGRFSIRDSTGSQVAELEKDASKEVELALPSGQFQVVWRAEEYLRIKVNIAANASVTLSKQMFEKYVPRTVVLRGNGKKNLALLGKRNGIKVGYYMQNEVEL